jgi:hypothetical protein
MLLAKSWLNVDQNQRKTQVKNPAGERLPESDRLLQHKVIDQAHVAKEYSHAEKLVVCAPLNLS